MLVFVLTGCGYDPHVSWVGVVSQTSPFCVARHDAGGACLEAHADVTKGFPAGECVRITAVAVSHEEGTFQLTRLTQSSASGHRASCPKD